MQCSQYHAPLLGEYRHVSNDALEPIKRQGERNPGASFQQKLRNHARAAGEDIALVLIRYINERFLYRLSVSEYRDRFILRGATLFTVWNSEPHRSTRDIDLMAEGDSSPAVIRDILANICTEHVQPDGVSYLPETIHIEVREEARIYKGLHIEIMTTLGTARQRLEIDIAFGEAVTPPALDVELPVLLAMPAPQLRAYQRETAIAEKCEAMVTLGIPNTRMKDFYDIWYLSRTYSFEGTLLYDALQATFLRRNTLFPSGGIPAALTEAFITDPNKQRQWIAFLGKTRLAKQADPFPQLIASIRAFLQPPMEALAENREFRLRWSPISLWNTSKSIEMKS